MIKKIKGFALRHKFISAGILIVVAFVGYKVVKAATTPAAQTKYVVGTATTGSIISSVSASGQISASDQIDMKPKVSGELTSVRVTQGQQVKTGDIIAQVDSRDAVKAVRDAQTALETARLQLQKLQDPASELSMTQAENAVVNAQRALEKAQNDYAQLQTDSTTTVANAYDDGYSAISSAFLSLPSYVKDIQDVMGTSSTADANISSYKLILGNDSVFISKFLSNYNSMIAKYNTTFTQFRNTDRSSDTATIYSLISATLDTTKSVSQTLESARNMLDAMATNTGYQQYAIASTIDLMRPKIASDISAINSNISAVQKSKDTIDATVEDAPTNLKNAQDAIASAQASLTEKQLSLAQLKEGPDSLDVRSQQITIQQKQDALTTAQQNLADYTVRAPFDGVIASVSLKKGDTASSGTAIASLITKQQIAEVTLNEIDAVKVKAGQKATLTFDAIDGLSLAGTVAEVDTVGTVTQGVVSYGVKIGLDTQDDRVKAGMSVNAAIVTDMKQNVLTVPNSAVKSSGGSSYVEVFNTPIADGGSQGTASANPPQQIPVEIGTSNDSLTEIVSGISEGQQVVTRTIAPTAAKSSSSAPNILQATGSAGRTTTGGATNLRGNSGGQMFISR